MNKNCERRAEAWVNEKILQILSRDGDLAKDLEVDGFKADLAVDPDFADYLGDLVLERLGSREPKTETIHAILRGHAQVRKDTRGRMMTQRTELWERYPLEALLRLLWRTRREEGEVTFLRGSEPKGGETCFWRAQIRREGENWVLVCRDEEGRNYMYMATVYPGYEMDRKTFGHEVRDFLGFHEGTVWLSSQQMLKITEVTE